MRRIFVVLLLMLASCKFPLALAATSRPAITGLAYVRILVTSPEKAATFYDGGVGLSPINCVQPSAQCFFINPAQQVDLQKKETGGTKDLIAAVGIYTSNAAALRSYLRANGQHPGKLSTDDAGMKFFQISDPEHHLIEFVQPISRAGSVRPTLLRDIRMIHAGFVVKDRTVMDAFYKTLLGFKVYWSGGMTDRETDWVDMQVPDGTDWIEYMLNVSPKADHKELGVMNHIALGVPDVRAAAKQLEAAGMKLTEQPQIGRDGKWQLNLYDPDFTRVELMEFTPVQKSCCSDYSGTHPKP